MPKAARPDGLIQLGRLGQRHDAQVAIENSDAVAVLADCGRRLARLSQELRAGSQAWLLVAVEATFAAAWASFAFSERPSVGRA
ncbi:MAG TPA: hypothetical protein VHM48_12600 [Candidatus Limnocylindrales bacterium]|nr:hypothetical protein [Candidatus Limnocylindrales bacterium]